jgi:hypothetical protein
MYILLNRDTSEVIENRLAVNSDYEFVGSLPRNRATQQTPSSGVVKPAKSGIMSAALNKNEPIDKGKFILPLANGSPEEFLNDMVDAMVISNRQAVSAPSKVNGDLKDERKVQSELTKRKEQEEQETGPAETVSSHSLTKDEGDQQQSRLKVKQMFLYTLCQLKLKSLRVRSPTLHSYSAVTCRAGTSNVRLAVLNSLNCESLKVLINLQITILRYCLFLLKH